MAFIVVLLCCECEFLNDEDMAVVSSCTTLLSKRYVENRDRCTLALSIICELSTSGSGRIRSLTRRIKEFVMFRARVHGNERLEYFTQIWNVACLNFESMDSIDRQALVNLRYLSNLHEFLQMRWGDCFLSIRDPREKSPGDHYIYELGNWISQPI